MISDLPAKTLTLFVLLAPALLVVNMALRFLRWRLLLRGAGVNVSERLSLRVYLSSFAFNFTPLYLGPTIYRVLAIMRSSDEPTVGRRVLGVAVAEVVYDAVGVAIVGFIAAIFLASITSAWPLALVIVFVLLSPFRKILVIAYCVLINAAVKVLLRRRTILPAASFSSVFSETRFLFALVLSVLAWLIPPLLLYAVDQSMARQYSLPIAMRAVAEASLLGPLSASPGGAGVTDTVLHNRLETLAVSPAVSSIYLYRLGTYWLALLIGVCVLLFGVLARRAPISQRQHFEAIASVYDAQIPEPVRQRLLERKTAIMLDRLPQVGLWGLDLGCGQGHYASLLSDAGYSVVGVDGSIQQLLSAKDRIQEISAADATRLPFPDSIFDFVYSINVLHHLPTRAAQAQAFAEIKRILKPGGQFFLYEINTINPLFRFYMGYIFPILREIDTGEEHWIRPDRLMDVTQWEPREILYYTFLPDFLPEFIARNLFKVERRFEASRYNYLSAHFTACFSKE